MQRFILLFMWLAIIIGAGCSPKYARIQGNYSRESKNADAPDYSDLYYWAAHPDKKDPSDSTPRPLLQQTKIILDADVFFLHPTSFTSRDDSGWNAPLNNTNINAKTDYSSILYQASAFNECRVYAPRYRQAHLRSYYSADTVAKQAFELAYQDIKTAFTYYLQHLNYGRPIIIAAHSQGSTHAQRLLKEFFDGQPLKEKLVVAYMPGMYIPADYFTQLKAGNSPTETGCFVGWRTFKRGYLPDFVIKEKGSCLVTNPLNWTTSNDYAGYNLNKGGVATQFNQIRNRVSDAQIHEGVLWINRPRIPGSIFLKMKNFHIGDINLFYMNIRENLRERVRAYQQLHAA